MRNLQKILLSETELSHGSFQREPIILSSRIRIARNIQEYKFPAYASVQERKIICQNIINAIGSCKSIGSQHAFLIDDLSEIELDALVERRLCSKEFSQIDNGAALIFSIDQSLSIMINEEDHMRIQSFTNGLHFEKIWEKINDLDDEISQKLNIAFDNKYGYLTACPTNVGTGLRASAMLHLPGLVITKQIKDVIETTNKLGLVVRGTFGEGSEATGEIFQISNQQTLGMSENEIIRRLEHILRTIISQEQTAREFLIKEKKTWLLDHIGRALGILKCCYAIDANEAQTYLSLLRLAVDLDILPETWRTGIDRLMIEMQSGHIQLFEHKELTVQERDIRRGAIMRVFFSKVPDLKYI